MEDASRRLGCAVRTVWRDLSVLQDAGFPIYDEPDGRRGLWKVERTFLDRLPIPFSLPEVVALLASRDMLDPGGAGPFGPAVASAFAKIEALMTPRALALVARMRSSVGTRATPSSSSGPASTWRRSTGRSPSAGRFACATTR